MTRFAGSGLPDDPFHGSDPVIGIINGLLLSTVIWATVAAFWLLVQ